MATAKFPRSIPLAHRLFLILTVVGLHLALIVGLHTSPQIPRIPHAITLSVASINSAHDKLISPARHTNTLPPAQAAVNQPFIAPEPEEGAPANTALPNRANEINSEPTSALLLADREPDFQAAYLNNPAPVYPLAARRMGWQGKALVRVEVLADGRAGQVGLQQSSGYKMLDEAAMQAVKNWRFNPARHAGQLIDKWFLIPIPFVLKESE